MNQRLAITFVALGTLIISSCGGPSEQEQANSEKEAVKTTVRGYYKALLAGEGARACALLSPAEAKAAGEWGTELEQVIGGAFGQKAGGPMDCVDEIESSAKSLKGYDDAKFIKSPKFQSVVVKGANASVTCCGGKIEPRLTKTNGKWLISGGLYGDKLEKLRANTSGG